MKTTLGKPYQVPSGRWVVYIDCPDGRMRRFTCRATSPVYEVNLNPNRRKTPRRPIRARFDVLARDNYTCRYCGRYAPTVILHVDHIIPVAKGGSDDPANLITACADCNEGKGTRHSGTEEPPPTTFEMMRAAMDSMDSLLGDG